MDGGALVSSYLSCKRAQTESVNFLCVAGAARRSISEVLGSSPSCYSSSKNGMTKPSLSAHQLMLLAKEVSEIAATNKKAPIGIEDAIKSVKEEIRQRIECARWYQQRQEDKDSDERHRYRIYALFVVLEYLRAAQKESIPPEEPATDDKPNTHNAPASFFEHLELEDTGEEFVDLFQNGTPPPPPEDTPQELEKDLEDEARFAFWCYMEDIDEMLDYLRSQCTNYKTGSTMAQHMAVVTEVAMRLLQTSVKALLDDFPELDSLDTLAELLGMTIAVEDGGPFQVLYQGAAAATDSSSLLDKVVAPAWALSALFGKFCGLKGSKDTDNAIQLDTVEEHMQRGHPLGRYLLKLYPHIQQLAHDRAASECGLSLDTFTEGLLEMFAGNKKLTLQTAISFKVQMDIFDILGDSRGQVYADIEKISNRERTSISKAIETLKKRDGIYAIQKLEDVLKGNVAPWMKTGIKTTAERAIIAIAREIPTLAGWLSWNQTWELHRAGVKLCQHDNMAVVLAHLYQLTRTSCDSAEWRDMKDFKELQGDERLGIRNTASSKTPILDAERNFGKAMGGRAHTAANMKIRRHLPKKMQGKEDLTQLCLCSPDRLKPLSLSLASTFMRCCEEAGASDGSLLHGRPLPVTLHDLMESVIREKKGIIDQATVDKWKKDGTLSHVEILEVLQATLEFEKLTVAYDYYGFFATCTDVLREIRLQFAEALSAEEKDEATPLYDMVYSIMFSAANGEHHGQDLSKLLRACGLMLNTHVARLPLGEASINWAKESIKPAQKWRSIEGRSKVEAKEVHKLLIRGGEVTVVKEE